MKTLIAEDEFTSRRLLEHVLSTYGPCQTAVNGDEALEAFEAAIAEGEPFDLVCLDILMPGLDGQDVLRAIRAVEEANDIAPESGAKVIMTSVLKDGSNVMRAFREQCDAYLVKPVDRPKFEHQLRSLGLIG